MVMSCLSLFEEPAEEFPLWVIAIILLVVVAVAVGIVVLLIRKRRRRPCKKSGDADRDSKGLDIGPFPKSNRVQGSRQVY